MARPRAKSPPRLTRDAERLIALANGLNASGSLTEDHFWEAQMSALVARLLEHGNDAPIDGALDHLYQNNLGAYDTLIELVENESESVASTEGEREWQSLLVAAPIVVWSKYAIPSGAISREHAQTLQVHLQAHVLAAGARVAMVPYLYSIDQLPRHFSELRRLAAKLSEAAIANEKPKLELSRLPETAHLLADTRFVIACAAVPKGQALFRWQEDASGHAGRTGSLEQWIAQARPTISKILPGAYHIKVNPAPQLDGIVGPTNVTAFDFLLVTSIKVPEETVYQVIKAIHDGKDSMVATFPALRANDPDKLAAKQYPPLEYHPGAIKYYTEIGKWPPKG